MDERKRILKNSRSSISSDSSDEESYPNDIYGENHRYNVLHTNLFKKFALCGFMLLICVLLYIPLSHNVQTRMVAIPGWNLNTSRDTINYVIPNLNTTLIDPIHICKGKDFLLLIVVCSSANNFDARHTIRETWGNITEFNHALFNKLHINFKGKYLDIKMKSWQNYVINDKTILSKNESSQDKNFSVKIVFLIGQTFNNETQIKINQESEIFNDIIQESFIDSYNNLTLKSVMMLKWVNNNCLGKVKFIMKCDDDIFLNLPNLLHVLLGGTVPVYNATVGYFDQKSIMALSAGNRLLSDKKLLMGYLFCHAKPIADTSSKWYSPIYMYSGEIYPNYLSGTGYLMSMDTIQSLYNASLTTPLFHLEDIYITGICSSKIKLRPRHHPLFIYNRVSNPCSLRSMITQHQLSPDDIRKAYDFVLNSTIICPPPSKYFNAKKVKIRQKFCQ